jgi:ceramide glucosyltransferase
MVTTLLVSIAVLGFFILLVQRAALSFALRGPPSVPTRRPGISLLKPLCGVDDALAENLRSFSELDYPEFEVLLGVKDRLDAAWPLACALAARDARFRVVQQRSTPGLNPKVNQLVTLAAEAKHELLLVSDSNARLPSEALHEVAALFEDAAVACVTHPVSGRGHVSFGALLDNLHLASGVGAAQLGAKALVGKDLVVGKSMALRRDALEALGGFSAYADVLAEDYVIGQDLRRLGLQVRVARTPVWNVAVHRSVRSFFERYLRWGVIHRTAVTLPISLGQGLVNPLPLLLVATLLEPTRVTFGVLALGTLVKTALDVSAARALCCDPIGWRALPAVVVKDALLFVTWFHGLWSRTVVWRGNRLRVGSRSRLLRPTGGLRPVHAEAA